MRKLLLPLLLASVAATPAFAQRPDRADRQEDRVERQQAREDRQQARDDRQQAHEEKAEPREQPRVEQVERTPVEPKARLESAPARGEAVARANRQDVETIRVARDVQRNERIEQRQEGRKEVRQQRDIRDSVRTPPKQTAAERKQARDQRLDAARADRDQRLAERRHAPVISNTPREGTQPPPKAETRNHAPTKWNGQWRNNHKYDWYNWRKRNRWIFNLGFYNDPFGWGYRPYSIGWRMWPSYYSSSYWLNDPWEYRLPYAPPGYRWIRYYDDAILIDTWNGQVVDVIYNFFW